MSTVRGLKVIKNNVNKCRGSSTERYVLAQSADVNAELLLPCGNV